MKKSFADIVAAMDSGMQKKIAAKIPSWAEMEVPGSLAFEQCSSEDAASYKLRFVPRGGIVADLTGGLGVDSTYFASVASELYYYECNTGLFEAVVRNFELRRSTLPQGGTMALIHARNETVGPDTELADCDLIFADPARRSTAGRKVFLLEDCTPNMLELMPLLWHHSPRVLLKLSPMADIDLVIRRLGRGVKEIHVVEIGGEVKELLVYMERDYVGEVLMVATDTRLSYSFTRSEEVSAPLCLASAEPGKYVYVPSGAMLKAGAYNSPGLPRLGAHSHLYISADPAVGSVDGRPLLGRSYLIEKVLPFSSKSIRELAGTLGSADVSCHDLPLRSEELSARLKVKGGGRYHIFASPSVEGNVILICKKIPNNER